MNMSGQRGASRNEYAELIDEATEESDEKRCDTRMPLQDGHEDDRLPIDPFDP
jgi:hypothetical protein